MKRTYIVKDGVTIEVRHNPFSGRYSVWENDESFRRVESKLFRKDINGESVNVRIDGNIFKGVSVRSCGTDFVFTEPCGWYTIALAIVPFVLSMVLSSITALANAGFYFVGGAIGGAVSGGLGMLGLYFSASMPKWWQRVLISVGFVILAFLACWGLGTLIVTVWHW